MSIKLIQKKIDSQYKLYEQAKKRNFANYLNSSWRIGKGSFDYPGVYVIYEGTKPIYVGMAGKGKHYLNYRLGDLFYYGLKLKKKFKHNLTEKLLEKEGRFSSIKAVREFYLKKCKFKVIKTESAREARIMEGIMIEDLCPRYNSE